MEEFLASLTPEPFRVMGVDLRPLTYGHVVLLNRIGFDPPKDGFELFCAVQICHRTFQGGLDWVTKAMGNQGDPFIEDARRFRRFDLAQSFGAWGLYMQASTSHPEFCEVDGPRSERGAPFLAQLRHTLLSRCNYTPEYILNAPFGQCLWDYGVAIEDKNGYGLVGDYHRGIAEMLKGGRN